MVTGWYAWFFLLEGLEDFAERFSAVDGSQVEIWDHDCTVMAVIVIYIYVFIL